MFKNHQVISSSVLVRKFKDIALELEREPQALLILRQRGERLVLLNADIFEDLLHFKMDIDMEVMKKLNRRNRKETDISTSFSQKDLTEFY